MEITKLLAYALKSGASDLHLSVGSIPMIRINGVMKPLNMDMTSDGDMESILPQVMNDNQIQHFKDIKEIREQIFGYHIKPDAPSICIIPETFNLHTIGQDGSAAVKQDKPLGRVAPHPLKERASGITH